MATPSELGHAIKRERVARTWSREELAGRARVGVATLKRVENGAQQGMHSDTLTRIAAAFGVPPGTLTGQDAPYPGEAASAALTDLRDVLLSPTLVPGLAGLTSVAAWAVVDGTPRPVPELMVSIDAAWSDFWSGNFDAAVAVLPALIAEGRLAVAEFGHSTASGALAQAWELAATMMVFYGREDLAGIGAERAVTEAANGDDPMLTATVMGTLGWVLLHQGRYAEGEAVALSAATAITPARRGVTRPELAAYGNLLMTALAPRVAQGKNAVDLVEEATGIAAQLGRRTQVYQASFAPNTVPMQDTYGWAMLREPGRALRAAKSVDLAELPGIRRGRHHLDVAQALVDAGRYTAALNTLKAAAALSPEWFGHQNIARSLIEQIREEQTRMSDDVLHLVRVGHVDDPAPAVSLVI